MWIKIDIARKAAVALVVALAAFVQPALAQEAPPADSVQGEIQAGAKTVQVMGFAVVVKPGSYAVKTDSNVRKGPGKKHARVAGVSEGERVQVIGVAEGEEWFAISRAGETMGFIHNSLLIPVVDGTLEEEMRGLLMQEGIACDYRLRFEGKSPVQGGDFETSDYEIRFRCASQQGAAVFYAHMFFTEATISQGRHQIAIDVRSIGDGLEKYLTSNFYYHPKTGKLTFDGHTLSKFATPPEKIETIAPTIADALIQVMTTVVSTWTPAAWESLFEKMN